MSSIYPFYFMLILERVRLSIQYRIDIIYMAQNIFHVPGSYTEAYR